jgi:hypothetical protein
MQMNNPFTHRAGFAFSVHDSFIFFIIAMRGETSLADERWNQRHFSADQGKQLQ